jgi:hypothetical protein
VSNSPTDGISPSQFHPADNPAVMAHINLLQGIINRMAAASSSCKTWCIGLVSGLLSLAGSTKVVAMADLVLVPIGVFAHLDFMYLTQEIAYRDLHEQFVFKIRTGTYSKDDVFNARAPRLFEHYMSALVSWSTWPFYILGLAFLYALARYLGLIDALAGAHGP